MDSKNILEFLKEVAGMIVVGGVLILLIGTLIQPIEQRNCNIYAKQTGNKTEYIWYAGCYVTDKDGITYLYDNKYKN